MNVRELIVALGALDPTLPSSRRSSKPESRSRLSSWVVAGVMYEDEPAHDVAVLRPLED